MNDDLRLKDDASESGDEEIVVNISEPREAPKEIVKKSATLGSVVLGLFKNSEVDGENDKDENTAIPVPRPKYTMKFLYFIISVTLIFSISYLFVELRTLVAFTGVFVSACVPIIAIIFFYELNTRKEIPVTYLLIAFFIGCTVCVLLSNIENYISLKLIFDSINPVISEIFINIIKFVVAIFIIRTLKVRNRLGGILLIVSFYMGYSFCESISGIFKQLFVEVVEDGKSYSVIINDIKYLKRTMGKLLSASAYYGLFLPLVNLSSAVIVGYVLSSAEESLSKGIDYPKSTYLMVVVCIVLASLFVINSIFSLVKYTFRVFTLLMLVSFAVQTINTTLETEKFDLK